MCGGGGGGGGVCCYGFRAQCACYSAGVSVRQPALVSVHYVCVSVFSYAVFCAFDAMAWLGWTHPNQAVTLVNIYCLNLEFRYCTVLCCAVLHAVCPKAFIGNKVVANEAGFPPHSLCCAVCCAMLCSMCCRRA